MTSFDLSDNRILASLAPGDLALLRDKLERVAIPLRMVVEQPNTRIEHAYFPLSGLASVVAQAHMRRVEVGLLGRDGMTGVPLVMGVEMTPHETFVQVAGEAVRIERAAFCEAMDQSRLLRNVLLRWAHIGSVQISQTALANASNTIEERLARWLLMAHDRLEGNRIALTHEFLSLMLGVHRPGVTLAIHTLEAANLIRATRGQITIVSREKLQETAGEAYGVAEAEAARLFGA